MGVSNPQDHQDQFGQKIIALTGGVPDHLYDKNDGFRAILVQPSQ
jgi:hypothetical protein